MTNNQIVPTLLSDKSIKIDQLVRESFSEYGKDIIRSTFPNPIDGLKRVQLRYVIICHMYPDIQDTTSKIAIVVGNIRKLHPHGDVPIYEALVHLAQPWVTDPPLVYIDGNSGTYQGDSPANARYPEIATTEYTIDIFIKGVNLNNIPSVVGDSYLPEPKHLIPALPQALLMASFSVGCGYQSKTVSLNFNNVCDLVSMCAKHKTDKTDIDWNEYPHLFLPDFPTHGYLLNEKELLEEYKKGNYLSKIHIEGKVTLYKDKIVIHSFPHSVDFGNMIDLIMLELNHTKNSYLDKVVDDCVAGAFTDIKDGMYLIKLKRNVNVFDVYMYLKNKYKLSNTYVPNPNYATFNENIYSLSYPKLLVVWLNHRIALMKTIKNDELRKLNSRISEIDAIIKVLLNKSRFIELTNIHTTLDEIIPVLKTEFDISGYQAQVLMSKPLSSLLNKSLELLTEQFNKYKTNLENVYKSVANVPLEISENAQMLKRKYGKARNTVLPRYVGYVQFGIGYVQFQTISEIQEILDNFPKTTFQIYLYSGTKYKTFVDTLGKPYPKKTQLDTKYGIGDIFGFSSDPNNGSIKTVKLQNGAMCYTNSVVYQNNVYGYFYTGSKSIFIQKNGKVFVGDTHKELSLRKDLDNATGTISKIAYVHQYTKKTFYLSVMCAEEKNSVWLFVITPETTLIHLPISKNLIIYSHDTTTDVFVNIPEICKLRNTTQVLHIKDISKLLESKKSIKLDINSNKLKKNSNISLL